jgi:hypothetical protein
MLLGWKYLYVSVVKVLHISLIPKLKGKAEVRDAIPVGCWAFSKHSQFLNPGGSIKDRVALKSKQHSFPADYRVTIFPSSHR